MKRLMRKLGLETKNVSAEIGRILTVKEFVKYRKIVVKVNELGKK